VRQPRQEAQNQAAYGGGDIFYFERTRLNDLFREASKRPLVMVCAGAGYGKTSAVHDFTLEYQEPVPVWIQLSGRDNSSTRFWENYANSMTQVNQSFARAMNKISFPDTPDKMNQYISLLNTIVDQQRRIFVMDDFHVIEDPSVLRFIEYSSTYIPVGTSLFLVSRSTPPFNTVGLISKDRQYIVNENDLCFTENELAQFFNVLNIPLRQDVLREIMQDTGGWAFAINLIARSYQKAPGYGGYVRNAMKTNVFQLIETEIWDGISETLQFFLASLSLINHLSVDLISLLANGDEDLIDELEKQNTYVRRDSYINAYIIHPLFREFLCKKQALLSDKQKQTTYKIAGSWCMNNGFKIDALSYFETIGDYTAIVSLFYDLPAQIPHDVAKYTATIFDRAPAEVFDSVYLLAVMHFRVYICLGPWQKAAELAEYYEVKFLAMPEGNDFRNRTLCALYYSWGFLRRMMCQIDDCFDFDIYFEKSMRFLPKQVDMNKFANHCPGFWINAAGSSRKDAPVEYIGALSRTVAVVSKSLNGFMSGEDELARGELLFYRGNTSAAKPYIARTLELARENKQFEIVHRALLYTLRIAAAEGNFATMEQAMKETEAQLDEGEYAHRFINHDLSLSLYYYLLGLAEKIPEQFKQDFSPYSHAAFIENSGNQMKARFCFLTRQYPPLLSYIREMKQRESYLFGRLEMLAMESCVLYRMKDKTKAFEVLSEAYETASPNGLVIPFIELGKDMRTLTGAALKEPDSDIYRAWLEEINRKSTTYAKYQSNNLMEYRKANPLEDTVVFSQRQEEILADLSHGLSRADIASSRNLSENTVKMIITELYDKLGAENRADFLRIAVKLKVI